MCAKRPRLLDLPAEMLCLSLVCTCGRVDSSRLSVEPKPKRIKSKKNKKK